MNNGTCGLDLLACTFRRQADSDHNSSLLDKGQLSHYNDVTWASWRLKSPDTQLFIVPRNWPCEGNPPVTGGPLTKGEWRVKCCSLHYVIIFYKRIQKFKSVVLIFDSLAKGNACNPQRNREIVVPNVGSDLTTFRLGLTHAEAHRIKILQNMIKSNMAAMHNGKIHSIYDKYVFT